MIACRNTETKKSEQSRSLVFLCDLIVIRQEVIAWLFVVVLLVCRVHAAEPLDGEDGRPLALNQFLPHTGLVTPCLLYTSPSPRDLSTSRMPSSA